MIFDGTELRDDYTHWNVSNQVVPKEVRQGLLEK